MITEDINSNVPIIANERDLAKFIAVNRIDVRKANEKSVGWYLNISRQLHNRKGLRDASKLIQNYGTNSPKSKPRIGFMFLFEYDAKMKDVLPYWDKFPLVIPFSQNKDTFYGFNLHYMPYRPRAILLKNILDTASNQRMDETTKVNLTWKMCKNLAKLQLLKNCVHQYRWDHVRSSFRQIEPRDWGLVSLMPVHKFVGSTTTSIWAKTIQRR